MASFTAFTARISSVSRNLKVTQVPESKILGSRSSIAVFPIKGRSSFPTLLNSRRSHISCGAKTGTVEKVCEIVRKQLALPDDSVVSGESKFTALGADSLDTVEIVMELEEEFGISVEEESAQNIATVQDAADMIETLIQKSKAV